jgi:hypothetical protein
MSDVLSIDEYIFLMWTRSLTDEQRENLVQCVKDNTQELSTALFQGYPHDLLDIARTVSRN